MERADSVEDVDVVVIGAGFGGLAAALASAERGARVVLCETLGYPGGCASTYRRDGYAFESGATLFSGMGKGQLFDTWIQRYGLEVEVDWLDPVVEVRTPELTLDVTRDRAQLVRDLCALPGAPVERLQAFFRLQERVADVLWEVLDDPSLLPPLGPRSLAVHGLRLPRYLPLLRLIGRPLSSVLKRFDLQDFQPLRSYLNGLCQITIQCGVDEAEAPFAMGTMDYYWRGTGHVRGGIGNLATALCGAIERAGGDVRLSTRVRGLQREGRGWRVDTRRGVLQAKHVVANLIPNALPKLLGEAGEKLPRSVSRLAERVTDGWGACMLYRVVRAPQAAGSGPAHLELVLDPARPFEEGNHVFCSISGEQDRGRAPEGYRTMTVSTHVPMKRYLELGEGGDQGAYIQEIQDRMRSVITRFAPEWEAEVRHELPGSPRTFERFTGRPGGFVGGIPRRAGLVHYLPPRSKNLLPGLHLVGDSVFPGQSTLATALGGLRLAQRLS